MSIFHVSLLFFSFLYERLPIVLLNFSIKCPMHLHCYSLLPAPHILLLLFPLFISPLFLFHLHSAWMDCLLILRIWKREGISEDKREGKGVRRRRREDERAARSEKERVGRWHVCKWRRQKDMWWVWATGILLFAWRDLWCCCIVVCSLVMGCTLGS